AAGGGVIWAPANHLGAQAGYADCAEAGIQYLTAAAGEIMSPDYISWYARTSRPAVEFLDHHTRVALVPLSRPDYHIEWPGAAAGGRSLHTAALGADAYTQIAEVLRQ